MLVIYQESLHDAWSTKCKIQLIHSSHRYNEYLQITGHREKGSLEI